MCNRKKFHKIAGFTAILTVLLWASETIQVYGQEQAPPKNEAKDKKPAPPQRITASFYYPSMEPKQLFQILSETYQIQFEGTETVTGPLTLISPENKKVDLNGMLQLLNEAIAKQNKAAQLKGKIVRIVPVQDMEDRTITLKYADPEDAKRILTTRFMGSGEEDTEEKSRQPSFIEIHRQIKALIVRGPKSVVTEIEKYVTDYIDLPSGPAESPAAAVPDAADFIKKDITLQYADPAKVVAFLREVYLMPEGTEPDEKTAKAHVIALHPNLPRVIVEGHPDVVAEIEKVIATELDIKPAEPPVKISYISLDYMDVEEFMRVLENNDELRGKFKSSLAPNNTLIISSHDESIPLKIEELKKTFDLDRMEIRYVSLRNAQAADIAKLLKAIYPAEAPALPPELQRARRGLSRYPLQEQYLLNARQVLTEAGFLEPDIEEMLSGAISIIPKGELEIIEDTTRNGLLIRTFSRNFPKIIELIDELDQPRPLVMIDMFITEVTLDDSIELGVDFTYITDTATGTTHTITQSFTNLFSDSTASLSYQVINDNITAFIRAMQETGNLNVITRPQILTKENSEASISLGRDVPVIDKTTVSTEGAINSTVKYEQVQTILKVTPQIHPDGYITLKIDQTIDDVGTETFQISENFNPQVLIRRNAKTELRVKDGQTVCLGGFVGDTIAEKESKVPLLGDIPLLGELFKYSSRSRIKKELILFITPHILTTPEEMLRMTNEMRRNSNIEKREDRNTNVLEPQRHLVYPLYRTPIPNLPEPQSPEESQSPDESQSPEILPE